MRKTEGTVEGSSRGSVEGGGLTMAEASKLVDKAESTVRAWVRSQQVSAWQDAVGWWRIDRNSLLAHAAGVGAAKGGSRGLTVRKGAHTEGSVTPQQTPTERVLAEGLERERRINDELRQQVRELEQERTQHMAEMRAMLSRDSGGKEGVISRWIRR